MKKILTFLMIFVALFTFVACDTGNSSSGNGGNGTSNVEIINPDDVAKKFADCITDVDVENVVFSNGNWTVINIYPDGEMLRSFTLQATVKDNYFTYTSGTQACIVDASLEEDPELLDELRDAKNDEEKTAILIEWMRGMPEGATVTWDGLIATMTYPLSQEYLEEFSEYTQFSTLPEYAVIKTNADKTKYVISATYESDGREFTETYYIEKN